MVAPTRDTVTPLLLAPAGAVCVVAVLLLTDRDFGLSFATVVLLAYFLIVCYLAELLFVVPGVALRPSFRQPPTLIAVAYGMVVAWTLPLVRLAIDGNGWCAVDRPVTCRTSMRSIRPLIRRRRPSLMVDRFRAAMPSRGRSVIDPPVVMVDGQAGSRSGDRDRRDRHSTGYRSSGERAVASLSRKSSRLQPISASNAS